MQDVLRKIIEILPAKDKIKLGVLFILMLIGGALEIFGIGVIAGFVAVVANPDALFEIAWLEKFLAFFSVEDSRDILLYGTIFLIVVFLIKNTYLVFYKYIKSRFIFNRYKSISNRLFSIYMNVPYSFHLQRNSADLIRNITNESHALATNIMLPILQIATEGIMALGIIILLLVVEPTVTLITLILLGGISVLFLKGTKNKIQKHGKKALDERARIIKTVNEGIGGFKDTTVMNRQSWFVVKFQESVTNISNAHIYQQTIRQSIRPAIETIAIVGMLAITLFLLEQGYSIGALASILALFALSIQRLLPAINNIISEYSSLRYHLYALEPIYHDIITLKSYEKENQGRKDEKIHLKEKIELKNVSYNYPESKEAVLKDISLTIPRGSATGFVGATGSGKTTLIDLILGLLEPTEGNIFIDKKDIKENVRSWQKNIGYIPQFIYLSDDTVRNNIAFGLDEKEIDEKKINEAVNVSQLNEFVKNLPRGLDTFIGERGIRLSGGQRQRIGIARAIYNNPEILIMDEATSSLDNVTEKFIIEAIEQLKKDRTIIIIAHRLTTVKNCDKLYILKDGKIIDSGSYNELLGKSEDFKKMTE